MLHGVPRLALLVEELGAGRLLGPGRQNVQVQFECGLLCNAIWDLFLMVVTVVHVACEQKMNSSFRYQVPRRQRSVLTIRRSRADNAPFFMSVCEADIAQHCKNVEVGEGIGSVFNLLLSVQMFFPNVTFPHFPHYNYCHFRSGVRECAILH